MSATVIMLPIVNRIRPREPAWCEQYARELAGVMDAMLEPPPRTRPILITRQLSNCHRPTNHQPGE